MITWIGSTILAAAIGFVIGALWYGVLFGSAYADLRPAQVAGLNEVPTASVMIAEFVRCLIVAAALAYFINRLGITTLPLALTTAVVIWAGFQVVGLVGSVLHEGYLVKLYAIHMGDALVKLIAGSLIITALTSRFA